MYRRLTILLLMCALLGAQAVIFASEGLHGHSAQHCCALCAAGQMPFVQPAVAWIHAPGLSIIWLEPGTEHDAAHAPLLTAGESRAPPA